MIARIAVKPSYTRHCWGTLTNFPLVVLGAGTEEDTHVLVLEFVHGRSVDPWDRSEVTKSMLTLDTFHQHGIRPDLLPTLRQELLPDPVSEQDLCQAFEAGLNRIGNLTPHLEKVCGRLRRLANEIAAIVATDSLVLDPGDVRPENTLLSSNRCTLIDFENLAIRRRCLAIVALLQSWPNPEYVLDTYRMITKQPLNDRTLKAASVWTAVHRLSSFADAERAESMRFES